MATGTKSLGEAMCSVIPCSDDAYYKTTKTPRVFNYRCSTGEHWGTYGLMRWASSGFTWSWSTGQRSTRTNA